MKNAESYASALGAVIIGFASVYFAVFAWGYIAAYTPAVRWFARLGLQDMSLRLVLYPLDFAVNVLLALPAALLIVWISRVGRSNFWVLIVLAVVPQFIRHNYHLVGDAALAEYWLGFLLGSTHEIFALPVAALLVRRMGRPRAPNVRQASSAEAHV
jgi:hypothetical protein